MVPVNNNEFKQRCCLLFPAIDSISDYQGLAIV